MKRVLSILMLLLLLFGLFACKDKDDPKEEIIEYEVTYSTALLPYSVSTPAAERVKKGWTISEPTLDAQPSAGKMVIWTTDATTGIAFDFDTPIEENTTLYAIEIPRPYQITYLIEHGMNSKKNPTAYTKASDTITLAKPTVDFGYRFWKWSYFDDPESNLTEIESGSEGDLILRADIRPADYHVLYADVYSARGDINPNPDTYTFGTELILQTPEREGYTFKGFTIYGDKGKTPVTVLTAEVVTEYREKLFHENGSDIYLLANWEVNQ